MEEIKRRVTVIQFFLSKPSTTPFAATTIESACLQVRKILELIALASLVANKFEFANQNEKFSKVWNARLILQDIERINADFYPKPIKEVPGKHPNDVPELISVKSGYLTRTDFLNVYEKCGKIMHADNPFGGKADLSYFEKQLPKWLDLIMNLLSNHTIKLANDENMYVIHMKEDRDDHVHGYTFAPIDPAKAQRAGAN